MKICQLKPEARVQFLHLYAQRAAFAECQGALLRDFAFDLKGKSPHKLPCYCTIEMQDFRQGLAVRGEWSAMLRHFICVSVGLPQVRNSWCDLGHNIQLEDLNQKHFWKEYDKHENQDKRMREAKCPPRQLTLTHYQQPEPPSPPGASTKG